MSDLINRQAALDALGEEPEVWTGKDEYAQGLNNQWHYDVNALKALPSAQSKSYREGYQAGFKDAQSERKKGQWIPHEDEDGEHYGDKCSECGEWYVMPYGKAKYCPNCGAEMEVSE